MRPPAPLFLSHGAPDLVLSDAPARRFLSGLGAPRPRAIVVVSAHHRAPEVRVSTARRLATMHDFRGFDPALRQVVYPALGEPRLAARIVAALDAAGLAAAPDPRRGLDHGAWVPLSLMLPGAEVPIVAVSLLLHGGPADHLALGRALRPFVAEGVQVIGSGSMSHNLEEMGPGDQAPDWVECFTRWMAHRLAAGDRQALLDYRAGAPAAPRNHPTEEHLLPLFVALGAAGDDWRATRLHASVTRRSLAMDAYRFDPVD